MGARPTDERWAAELLARRDPVGMWPAPRYPSGDWQLATVIGILAETPEAVTLQLRRSGADEFLPGQHFNIEVPTADPFPALEAYSVASSPWPDPQKVGFTIKEVPGGRASPVLVRRIPIGAALRIEGPFGNLTWSETDGGPLVLIGAGSGIVPLMAIIRYAVARQLDVPMRLLYSSKDRLHTIYYRELRALSEKNPWLEVIHAFTADGPDPAARYHRRMDVDMIGATFAGTTADCLAYLCGPPGAVRTAETALSRLGVEPGRIMSEEWE